VALTAAITPAGDGIEVEIANPGPEPVRFSTATMRGSAAFDLADAAGRPVPLGPPPLPPSDLAAGLVTLAPGESTTLRYRLGDLLPDGPPAGRHRLRFAAAAPPLEGAWYGRLESPWVELGDQAATR
jgi:hypothetical protein